MYRTSTKSHHWSSLARHTSSLAITILVLVAWATLWTSRSIAKQQPHIPTSDLLESSNITLDLIARNLKDDSNPTWYTGPDPNTTPDTQLSPSGKLIKKGNLLLCMMRAAPGSPLVLPTSFTDPSSLAANGWSPTWITPNPDITTSGLNLAFVGTGVSYSPSDWVKIDYQHSESSVIDGKTYPATQATYSNSISLADGALLAEYNYGPGYSIKATGGKGVPPPLARWSDVVFLAWKEAIAKYPNLHGTKGLFSSGYHVLTILGRRPEQNPTDLPLVDERVRNPAENRRYHRQESEQLRRRQYPQPPHIFHSPY